MKLPHWSWTALPCQPSAAAHAACSSPKASLQVQLNGKAFGKPKAAVGEQPERIGETRVWVLPNPSGLNAHYQADALARVFRELWEAAA